MFNQSRAHRGTSRRWTAVRTNRSLDGNRLLDLVRDGFPIYAWTYQERHAWTTTRARTARFVLSWLTSPTDRGMARN